MFELLLPYQSVQPFIPPSDRITAMTGDGMLFFSTCMGSYTNLMTNAIWMPAAGQGLTNACYLNTYSGTGVGYTYITTPTTGTNQLVYCSGRSGTANDVTTLYPTLEKCLSSGNCWQVTAGYDAQLDDGIEDSSGQGTDISYGCYGGVTSSSINGGGFVNVPTAYPVTDGAPFNLYDTQGNFASLDSVNGGMKLGTSGLPISLQFNSSANNELRNKVLCAGEWTSLYAPGYGFVYQNYEEGLLSRLNSENVGIPAMTLIQSKSATNSYFIYFPEAVCYLSYDYANNVGRCRRTLDKATPWIFKPVTWT